MKTTTALAIGSLLLVTLSTPASADHPGAGTPTTFYDDLYAGSLSCNTGGYGATTPTLGSYAVGAPDHAHVTLLLDVVNNGPLACWGRIELGTPTWIGATGTLDEANDGQCGPIVVGATGPGACTATAFFAFTRPFHSAGLEMPYCIKYSIDGINFQDPGSGPVCSSFRFIDPPVVEAQGSPDALAEDFGMELSILGEQVL